MKPDDLKDRIVQTVMSALEFDWAPPQVEVIVTKPKRFRVAVALTTPRGTVSYRFHVTVTQER